MCFEIKSLINKVVIFDYTFKLFDLFNTIIDDQKHPEDICLVALKSMVSMYVERKNNSIENGTTVTNLTSDEPLNM